MKPITRKTVFEFRHFTATLVQFEEHGQTTVLEIAQNSRSEGEIRLRFRDREKSRE